MIIFWILYGLEMRKTEKKRDKTYLKFYLIGAVLLTISGFVGIVLSFMEYNNPYNPQETLHTQDGITQDNINKFY